MKRIINKLQQKINAIKTAFIKMLCVSLGENRDGQIEDKENIGRFEKRKNWIIMSFLKSKRLIEHFQGKDVFKTIIKNSSDSYIIHYSCESFLNTKGRTPRIVSISIMNLNNSQIYTYSIHLEAQFLKYEFNNLSEEQQDICEKSMLDKYYLFLKDNTSYFIHWMMNDCNFGFNAIDNRYLILGGSPITLKDKFKINLPQVLCWIYSYSWEKDGNGGRLKNSAERHKMKLDGFLTGAEEAKCYENKKWLELQNSTLSKVKIMKNIIEHIKNDKFETKSNWKKIYGISLESFKEIINGNILLSIIWWSILLIIGAIVGGFIKHLMFP